jgi:hypothetical protein
MSFRGRQREHPRNRRTLRLQVLLPAGVSPYGIGHREHAQQSIQVRSVLQSQGSTMRTSDSAATRREHQVPPEQESGRMPPAIDAREAALIGTIGRSAYRGSACRWSP